VAGIADRLSISERQLRRRVATAVGYGPKRLARILRLYRALETAHAARGLENGDLARVAFDAGYADQAHFANECRLLAGVPPSAVLSAWTERDRFLQDGQGAQRDDAPHDHT
jgi:transcriptional regulator GlxA family with amidase domain